MSCVATYRTEQSSISEKPVYRKPGFREHTLETV